MFSMNVKSWSYIEISGACSDEEEIRRTISILREEMSTDRVSYDSSIGVFIVEPSDAVSRRVRDISKRIVKVDLTTYSILSRFGHCFFDALQADGRWAPTTSRDSLSDSSVVNTISSTLRVTVWSAVDSRTIAFVRCGNSTTPTVNIWTAYSSFSNPAYATSASSAIMGNSTVAVPTGTVASTLDINVKTFSSEEEIVSAIIDLLKTQVDIAVHYGDDDATESSTISGAPPGPFAIALRRIGNGDGSLEVFNLRDYVENVYTDMSAHDFKTIITEVGITSSATDDAVLSGAAASFIGSPQTAETSDSSYIPDLRSTVHSAENITFFIEKISARAYLAARLFDMLSKSIYDLAQISGCNISTLTQREHTSRGIVSFIDPKAARSQIVDTLPHDFIEPGFHPLTYVTPFSSVLISQMCESANPLAVEIGNRISHLKPYWWIVREIFCLRDLRTTPPREIPSVYGIFRGMLYSTREIPRHDVSRQWSSIMCVGLGSWIGVTITAPPATLLGDGRSSPTTPSNSNITFGYFGIEDVCRHPFGAVRTAVEMFLSLKIFNTAASPKTVAASLTLTSDNMAIRRRVTSANVSTFASLLPHNEVAEIASGKKSVTLLLWYKTPDKYTTNPILADRRVYVSAIEAILNKTFPVFSAPKPPPVEAAPPPKSVEAPPSRPPVPSTPQVREQRVIPVMTEIRTADTDRVFPPFSHFQPPHHSTSASRLRHLHDSKPASKRE